MTDNSDSDFDDGGDEKVDRTYQCDLCFGNGFIYAGPTSDPCPKCWGEGEVTADELDEPPA